MATCTRHLDLVYGMLRQPDGWIDDSARRFTREAADPGGGGSSSSPSSVSPRTTSFPDLAGWRRKRLPVVPDAARLELAPDWVCEILSPSTERIDRGLKLGIYARERVSHSWLLNPDARTLEVFRLLGGECMVAAVHTGETPARAEPFEAIELDLKTLWGEIPA